MRVLSLALAIIALALPAAAAAGAPAARDAATANVQIGDFLFRPGYSRIEPGDTVSWTMLQGSPHTVTSRAGAPVPFDSGELLPGQQHSLAFATAGRYPYLCTLHPFMKGVVQVGPDTVDPVLARPRAKVGKRSVRISYRLSEHARVSATVAAVGKPKRTLRRVVGKKLLEEGRRSLTVKAGGLEPGRYRASLTARDPEGNVGKAKAAFEIPR